MAGTEHVTATVSWANSAAAGTAKTVDVPDQPRITPGERHVVVVHNASAETALTVVLQTVENLGGADRYAELERFTVAVGETVAHDVVGWLTAAGRIVITNDTAVGLAGAFDAYVRVREAG